MDLLFARCEFPHKRCLINQFQRTTNAHTHTISAKQITEFSSRQCIHHACESYFLRRVYFSYKLCENFPTQIGNVLACNGIGWMRVGGRMGGNKKRKNKLSWYITCSLNLSVCSLFISNMPLQSVFDGEQIYWLPNTLTIIGGNFYTG